MVRITPDQVVEAYRKTGVKPMQGNWHNGSESDLCCCGLGALYLAAGEPVLTLTLNSYAHHVQQVLNIPGNYLIGFTNGFDGKVMPEEWVNREFEPQGFHDGRLAWATVQREILGVPCGTPTPSASSDGDEESPEPVVPPQ